MEFMFFSFHGLFSILNIGGEDCQFRSSPGPDFAGAAEKRVGWIG